MTVQTEGRGTGSTKRLLPRPTLTPHATAGHPAHLEDGDGGSGAAAGLAFAPVDEARPAACGPGDSTYLVQSPKCLHAKEMEERR